MPGTRVWTGKWPGSASRRPQYLVFAIDRFQVVGADDVTDHAYRFPELDTAQLIGPILVRARFPDDPAEQAAVKKGIFFDGHPDIDIRPDHWYPWQSGAPSVLSAAGTHSEFRRRSDVTALVDAATGYPVAMLDIDPWQ